MALAAVLTAVCVIPAALANTSASLQARPQHRVAGLTLGFSSGAVPSLTAGSSGANATWTKRGHQIGAQMVRLGVSWAGVAPSKRPSGFQAANPASSGYDWTALDAQVRELTSEHFRILITVNSAPTWAEGANRPSSASPGSWKPDAAAFEKFAHAIAARYDGKFPDPLNPGHHLPKVSDWQGWNEPNLSQYLAPQWRNDPSGAKECRSDNNYYKFSGKNAESPALYRALANAFYSGVKSVSGSNVVVLAGTAPYGNPNCEPIGGGAVDYRIPPVTFDRDLFCLTPSDKKSRGCDETTHLNALDNHPYSPPYSGSQDGPHWSALNDTDVAIPDVGRLAKILSAAGRAGTALPRGDKEIWVTETAWDTKPKDPYGVPEGTEARWMEEAFYELWSEGVRTILWWTLADAKSFSLNASPWPSQSGEFTYTGAAKPSASSFRFPFITHRTSRTQIKAWGRAPAGGMVTIERRSGNGWRTVASFRAATHEVFQLTLNQRGKATFRAIDAGISSLTWSQAG